MSRDDNHPSVFAEAYPDPEWHFEGCPPEQLHWLDFYEHGRDNELFVAVVEYYRAKGVWATPGIFPDHCASLLGKAFIDAFPEFPRLPFRSLHADERAARCLKLDRLRRQIHVHICESGKSARQVGGSFLVRIHPNADKNHVKKEIWKRLRDQRGGQAPEDRLQNLALARLFRHFGGWGAVLRHLEKAGSKLVELDDTRRTHAKGKAKVAVDTVLLRLV